MVNFKDEVMAKKLKNTEIYYDDLLYMLVDDELIQLSFRNSVLPKDLATIKNEKEQKVGWVEKVPGTEKVYFRIFKNGNSGVYKVYYKGQETIVTKTKNLYTQDTGSHLKFKVNYDMEVFKGEEKIATIVYPKTIFFGASAWIRLNGLHNTKYIFDIKMVMIAVSTNRAINDIDGVNPFSVEAWL